MPCILQGGGEKNIYIGSHTLIKGHCVLGCWTKYRNQQFTPKIEIGDNCNIGEYTQLSACNGIVIGEGLLTGQFVYIGDNSHGGMTWEEAEKRPVQRELKSKGPITIGKNVWLGDRVAILGGVTIGDNVIIGTNAVVTHDIPSNCVAAGIPAKVIKSLKN
jgi:acetyltransferase-like isoleucine patch superfamily enzyme